MKGFTRMPLMQNIISSNAETLRSGKVTIPAIIEEEGEATSELGTLGHTAQPAQTAKDETWEEISPAERMSCFWDNFDKGASAGSVCYGFGIRKVDGCSVQPGTKVTETLFYDPSSTVFVQSEYFNGTKEIAYEAKVDWCPSFFKASGANLESSKWDLSAGKWDWLHL